MRKVIGYLSLALALFAAQTAVAQDSEAGWYASVGVGASFLPGDDIDGSGTGALFGNGDADYDTGFDSSGAIGYMYGPNLAAEIEYIYRTNDVDSITSSGSIAADGGDLSSTSIMVNGYWHFDWRDNWRPYVGGGIGYATEVDIDLDIPGGGAQEDLEDSGFALQAMAGIEYRFTPQLSALGEARFFTVPGGVEMENNGIEYETDYDAFSIRAGLRYRF